MSTPPGPVLCVQCRAILARPQRFVRRTPGWFVAVLILIIAALALYAGYLAVDQLVWHNYNSTGAVNSK